jgi:mannose-6-phosphate isomerase-like protein (cupin superfamily)
LAEKQGDSALRSARWRAAAYDGWQEAEGVPVTRGIAVPDLRTIPVHPWARKGVPGAIVHLDGGEQVADAYVLELPPAASSKPDRHLFEELVYILEGRGAAVLWNDAGARREFEWQAGSVFALPLNTWCQFHNGSGSQRARYVAVTNAPLFMNLFHNQKFIFDCHFDFTDRFAGEQTDYSGEGTSYPGRIWETNFVPNVVDFPLQPMPERGAGGGNIMLELGGATMGAHISQFPVGTYKKAHRHGAGSHVILLSGEGYSLMWKDGTPIQRVDWKAGSMFVPPGRWYHQHFNVGSTPARYLALRAYNSVFMPYYHSERAEAQIEYENQDPMIHETFVAECAKRGVDVHMEAFIK